MKICKQDNYVVFRFNAENIVRQFNVKSLSLQVHTKILRVFNDYLIFLTVSNSGWNAMKSCF